jgi:hypothetical protein
MSNTPKSPDNNDPKSQSLVVEACKIPRETSLIRGFLRKKNSADKWQKRYFEVLSANNVAFFVYYKDAEKTSPMLCAMDLSKSSLPALVVQNVVGKDLTGSSNEADFAITWDRYRTFRAGNRSEAEKWVEAIKNAQSNLNSNRKAPLVDPQTAALAVDAKKSGALVNYGSANGTSEWGKKDEKRGPVGASFGGGKTESQKTSSSCCSSCSIS